MEYLKILSNREQAHENGAWEIEFMKLYFLSLIQIMLFQYIPILKENLKL